MQWARFLHHIGRTGPGHIASRWTRVDGRPVHARVSTDPVPDDRVPVVCVHGQVVTSRYMIPTMTHLAPHHPVYAPDLPGYGWSGKPDHTLAVPELADAVIAWMDASGLPRAAFLGNSFGCQVIADLAARYPERVTHVILQGPTTDASARTAWKLTARWLANSPREPVSLMPTLVADYTQAGTRRAVETFRKLLADRIEEKLPHVTAPALVVRGARDPIVPQAWAEEVTRRLPHGRLVVIPGAAHTLNYSAPLELTRVVRAFLRDHPAPGAANVEEESVRA